MSAPPSPALRVRVEEARGLLPPPERDAALYVTLRLAPAEARHSTRTHTARPGGVDPAWREEIDFDTLPPQARSVEFKVRYGELFSRAFLGRAVVPIPAPGESVDSWFALDDGGGGKHAADVAAACRRAGRRDGQLGALRLRVTRGDAAGAEASQAGPRTPPRTPPTPEEAEGGHGAAHRARHGALAALRHALPSRRRHAHRRDYAESARGSESESEREEPEPRERRRTRAASHVHVALVAGRNLLPSDVKPPAVRGDAAAVGATSDPYCVVRLLPGMPEERHVTRVARQTLNPRWEEELIFRAVPGIYGVEVWDHDPLTKDDYLGEALISLPPKPEDDELAAEAEELESEKDVDVDVTPSAQQQRRGAAAVLTATGGPSPRAAVAVAEAATQSSLAQLSAQEAATAAAQEETTPAARQQQLLRVRGGVTEGWVPLTASPTHEEEIREALARVGRRVPPRGGIEPGALGELFLRVSWGDGTRRSNAAAAARLLRPAAHRDSVATLAVRVHAARGLPLPPRAGAGAAVTVRCERQRGTTPVVAPSEAEVVGWPGDASTFSMEITEITSDVTLTVQYRQDGGEGDRGRGRLVRSVGEVVLPLPLLLAADAPAAAVALRARTPWTAAVPPRWARLLPPRSSIRGDEGDSRAAADVAPRGELMYEAALTLHRPAAWCYLVPEVLETEAELRGRSGEEDDESDGAALAALPSGAPDAAAAAEAAAARLADALLATAVAPLRTALYLQTWQAPALNAALLTLMALATMLAWPLAVALWPLWLALTPVLHGYVSYLIHLDDAVPGEPAAAAGGAAVGEPAAAQLTAGGTAGDDVVDVDVARPQLARFARAAWRAADALERAAGVFAWHDATLSALSAAVAIAAGVAACILRAALRASALLPPSVLVMLLAVFCFGPFTNQTRWLLDGVELYAAWLSPVPLRSVTGGAALRCTALETSPPPELSPSARRARLAVAWRGAAEQRRRAREAREAAAGGAPPTALQTAAASASLRALLTWLPHLFARAPDAARAAQLRLARRATLPAPEPAAELHAATTL